MKTSVENRAESLQREWLSTRAGIGVFGLALGLRFLLALCGPLTATDQAGLLHADSGRFLRLADAVREGHGFAVNFEGGKVHDALEQIRAANGTLPDADANGYRPESFRTPGYPLFLALCGGRAGIKVAIAVQCLLGALSAILAAGIASGLGLSRRAALLVGGLWAVHPGLIVFDISILSESLFLVVSLAGLFVAALNRGPATDGLSGLLIGIAGLIRPLGLLYLPLSLLIGWPKCRRPVLGSLAMLVLAIAPSVGWSYWNQTHGNGFRVSTVGEINLYFYGANYVDSEMHGRDWSAAWEDGVAIGAEKLAARVQPGEDVLKLARRMAVEEFIANPLPTVKVALKSQVKLMVSHAAEDLYAVMGWKYLPSGLFDLLLEGRFSDMKLQNLTAGIPLAWLGFNVLLCIFALWGAIQAGRRRQWRLLVGCLFPCCLFAVASFPVGCERVRLPMLPMIFCLAAASLPVYRQPRETIQN